VHVPAGAQQEPVCGGWVHGFGSQTPARVHVLVPVQAALVVNVQVPSSAQQEPVGWAQGFGVQTPPVVQVPEHVACVVTVQVPAAAQQAPVGWVHGFGEHVGHSTCQVLGGEQLSRTVTVQEPVSRLQHAASGCGHGLGEHVTHSECQAAGVTQLPCVVTVQVPSGVQQAPVGVGLVVSSLLQPAETIAKIAARVTSLRMVRPPSCRFSPTDRLGQPAPPVTCSAHTPNPLKASFP
jgi:hypothetical protein